MDAKDPNDWVARLNGPGSSLLAPFSSEATRKAGRQLVLLSALTILLSGGLVTFGEGTFAGLKFAPSKMVAVVTLAGLACAYFAILYVLDLYRDYQAARYQRMPALVDYQRLKDEALAQYNAKMEKADFLATETQRLLRERTEKRIQLGLDAPLPHYPSLSGGAIDDIEAQLAVREADSRQRQRAMDEFSDYCRNDGLDSLQQEQIGLAVDRSITARFEALLSLMRTTARLDRFRLVTEVVFPMGLALFAIIAVLRHGL
ncbi:hypothetical protein ASG87_14770 [Frateuria sp. Soil773]|uniref:hypothetical protein n=1 Tax=Frateuria sp. Soil773 TaxID=1736407 RepID=UPI0006F262F9|nr:hypothetical protein [Frateuria sp. Soil773]KRE97788.1 hypothetical protein ASG87_14770 [Frateuria sp. Soil773]